MTMQTEEPGTQEQSNAPAEGQQAEVSVAATEESASERERQLQERLTQQGRTLAEVRRANEALATQLAETNAHVALLGESMTQQQRDAEARRQAETKAYLESLPEDQRLREEVRFANERVERLEAQMSGRNAGPQARTSGSPKPQSKTESPQEYQTRRMREIIAEAQDEFGVTITRQELEAIPEEDWEREGSFHRAIFAHAARKANSPAPQGDDVTNKDKGKTNPPAAAAAAETPEEMEDRVRRKLLREMGVSSPATPRAAASRRTGPAPTEEDVKETVSTYNSGAGPKANIAKLKEMRAKMG